MNSRKTLLHLYESAIGPSETRLALEVLKNNRIRAETVITHRFPLKDVAKALHLVGNPGDALKMVLLP